MKHLYRAVFTAACFTAFLYSPSQALACACPSGVNCFEYCGGNSTNTSNTSESTTKKSSMSPYRYSGKSVLQYRNALSNRVNIGGTLNRLGSRIERAATGEMSPIPGSGRPHINVGVKLPTFGQVIGGITQNNNKDNPSKAQDSVGLGDLGTAVKNTPQTSQQSGTTPPPVTTPVQPPVTTPVQPPEEVRTSGLSSQMNGVLATVALEGSAMTDTEMNNFLENQLQDTSLTETDKNYIEALQSEFESKGTYAGAITKAKIDLNAIQNNLANTNLGTAASADITRRATDLVRQNGIQEAPDASPLEYTVITAQATAGDAVAQAVNQQWESQMGNNIDTLASENRAGLIKAISNEADISIEAATTQYNAIVGWIQDRAKEGRSYDEIMNSLKTNSSYLTNSQRSL